EVVTGAGSGRDDDSGADRVVGAAVCDRVSVSRSRGVLQCPLDGGDQGLGRTDRCSRDRVALLEQRERDEDEDDRDDGKDAEDDEEAAPPRPAEALMEGGGTGED